MSSGITSQYGFLFQRYAFVKELLEQAGVDKYFIYEGMDDIDVQSEKEKIMSIKKTDSTFIQVKSGTVDKDCLAKIIGNWLLIEECENEYRIDLENNLGFDITDGVTLDHVCKYFLDGKTKRSDSIANRVYKKCIVNNDDQEQSIRTEVLKILGKITCCVKTLEEIKNESEAIFSKMYCSDIVVHEKAKKCRFERFIDYMGRRIDESIEKKQGFKCDYPTLMSQVFRVQSEISDDKYEIDTTALKKVKKGEAEKMLDEENTREVRQLRLVNNNTGFIIKELVNELLYKDFRNVYSDIKGTQISNMEDEAHSNYEEVIYSLPENPDAKLVYQETVKMEIHSTLVGNSSIYRNGCYVYLTGKDIRSEHQITWGHDDE